MDALVPKSLLLDKFLSLVGLFDNFEFIMNEPVYFSDGFEEKGDDSNPSKVGYLCERLGIFWTVGVGL